MNNRAKYDREHSKTPKEFLKKSRLTTEPIGGGVVYDSKGEFVEYDVALEALKMAREEQKKQPKAELGADIKMEWDSFIKHTAVYGAGTESEDVVWLNWLSFVDIAKYFYELGRKGGSK